MKLKQRMMFSVLVVGMLIFSGCQSDADSSKNNNKVTEKKEEKKKDSDQKEKKTDKKDTEKKSQAKILVGHLEDTGLGRDDCILITNPRHTVSEESLEEILISTDQTVYNVELYDVGVGTVDKKGTHYFINEVIYQGKKLKHGQPLLVKNEFRDEPNLLFSYEDAKGNRKMISIGESGDDSSLIVQPALLQEAVANQAEEPRQYGEDTPIGPSEGVEEPRQYGEDVPIGPYIVNEDGSYYLDEEEVRKSQQQYGEEIPIGPSDEEECMDYGDYEIYE